MTITPDEIKRLRELHEKATHGPWQQFDDGGTTQSGYNYGPANAHKVWGPRGPGYGTTAECSGYFGCSEGAANARFIAAARTALPALLDEVERLREYKEYYELMLNLTAEHVGAKFKTFGDMKKWFKARSEEVERYREALAFYADHEGYEPQPLHPLHPNSWKCPVEIDQGRIARKTLGVDDEQ